MSALFVDHLTVMDFSFVHKERGILGESWIVDVLLQGELDDQGMVFDFGDVKKQIKRGIDDLYDHRLLIPQGLPELHAVRSEDHQLDIEWQDAKQQTFRHSSPESAVVLLPCHEVTLETVAPLIERQLKRLLPDNVKAISVTIRPEVIESAFYHYSHGLKKHLGNCQRIAHGHRSRIEIQRNGKRDNGLEKEWASRWRDIYIGTREDIVAESDTSMSFAYEAQQGRFEIMLPKSCCYLIDTDSTVEYLADHIAATLKLEHPDDSFLVKAYEGVMKGALGSR